MADTTITTSKMFSLNLNDFWKGLIMAVAVPAVTIITESLNKGVLTFDWKAIGIGALSGFVGYLAKNFLTPSQTIIKPAPDQPVVVPPQVPPGDNKP